jgi:probable rRNA maturation factor
MPLNIDVEDESWNIVQHLEELTQRAAAAALPASAATKELTVLFADDETLQSLNKDWRGKDKATNVLSFPAPENLKLPPGEIQPLGDIALGYATVAREAAESGKSVADHTAHLIVHGILHLLGYDHEDEAQATVMEAQEVKILKTLGIADPYQ